ncbi:MAG: glycosyltransferase family 2 protein [Patescibacteria group bacterium]|jgi:glycosyltransferase involved in cell wall biosynthesis
MISIIIPFYNEAESIPVLVERLNDQLNKFKKEFEIILVNDGSTDNPQSVIRNLNNIKLFNHKKRLGKGEALKTGIENSSGETIVFMDGDLQDDPSDLPEFLKKIQEGNELVNGIREKRNDNLIVKFYSKIVAWFLKTFLNSPYTDINCGYKVFDRKVLRGFIFYGNNFRFFPLAVFYNGYKVTEINVKNNKRMFGRSKFGPGKLFTGLLDTLTAYFLFKFSEKPLHFFGMIGGALFFTGFIISLYLTVERVFFNILLYRRPLLQFGILLIIIGIQVVMTGIIGELIVYQNKKK